MSLDITAQLNHIRTKPKSPYDENDYSNMSVMHRTQAEMMKQILREEKFRVDVLKEVQAFAHVRDDHLRFAAQNMEELNFIRDDIIIRQGEIGDSFFIIESGTVLISTRNNPLDQEEPPKVLSRLSAHQHFGELALLTAEPRSATVTVCSDTARLLCMKKNKFEEIIALSSHILSSTRTQLHKDVVHKVPIFQGLTSVNRKRLVERMEEATFNPGDYICRKGTQGNIFYIITEGVCKVTLHDIPAGSIANDTDGHLLHAGDYFGEVALIDASQKRTANVIAVSPVTCMTLSRGTFDSLLRDMRTALMEHSALRDNVSGGRRRRDKAANKRRISGIDERGFPNPALNQGLLSRMSKHLMDSLHVSLYARLYRDLVLNPNKVLELGNEPEKIFHPDMKRADTLEAIRSRVTEILYIEPIHRAPADHLLIIALLRQRNVLRERVCKDWLPYQYSDLCRKVKYVHAKANQKIFEADARGTTVFLILRGSVRLHTLISAGGTRVMRPEEDLVSGEIFGEAAFDGLHTRQTSAMALTPCDLVVIDAEDFISIVEGGSKKLSVDAKYRFLSKSSLFKGWESYRVIRIAQLLQQEEFPKGAILLRKGEISHKLMFVHIGRVDILHDLNVSQEVLTYVGEGDYIGESGFINLSRIGKSKAPVAECGYAVTHVKTNLLTLGEENFPLFDLGTLNLLISAFHEKVRLRINRSAVLVVERKKRKQEQVKLLREKRISEQEEALLSQTQINRLKEHRNAISELRRQREEGGSRSSALLPTLDDIEDIPTLLLKCTSDPLLIANTCKTEAVLRSTFASLRPKSGRSRPDGTLFASLSLLPTSSLSTASMSSNVDRSSDSYDDGSASGWTTPHTGRSNTSSTKTSRSTTSTIAHQIGLSVLPLLPGAYIVAANSEKNKDFVTQATLEGALRGSLRIPNSRSYYESLTATQALLMPSLAKTPRSSADAPFQFNSLKRTGTADNQRTETASSTEKRAQTSVVVPKGKKKRQKEGLASPKSVPQSESSPYLAQQETVLPALRPNTTPNAPTATPAVAIQEFVQVPKRAVASVGLDPRFREKPRTMTRTFV